MPSKYQTKTNANTSCGRYEFKLQQSSPGLEIFEATLSVAVQRLHVRMQCISWSKLWMSLCVNKRYACTPPLQRKIPSVPCKRHVCEAWERGNQNKKKRKRNKEKKEMDMDSKRGEEEKTAELNWRPSVSLIIQRATPSAPVITTTLPSVRSPSMIFCLLKYLSKDLLSSAESLRCARSCVSVS
ncbi:hypothetical protein SODALDRAFT_19773 [Sodiomyces alkalinus F11]|uniref:Uncharacterized protein n=1 Tax=Sodiomyces alkalinus (strain CBS 110278 / VKM F-3762 / F11) TaxID=1314773 RepID=A0A3N2Q768_SODAK|nr:hypothetical protein SODALDRAFT_19773 [Sodiomyces alkalinus F11]ROT42633.1 hypothetical protein SODALDRAFT_19773 [Sodiomyces alkalinus F11]